MDNVIWIAEWKARNNGRPYANQSSSSGALLLRQATAQFNKHKTY